MVLPWMEDNVALPDVEPPMMPCRLFAILAGLCVALPVQAQERPAGLVAVGDRVFLAPGQPDRQPTGEPPADVAHWMHVEVVFSEMDWFRALLDADPLLGPVQTKLEVTRLPNPPAYHFSDVNLSDGFGDRDRVPDALRIEGYDVQTRQNDWPVREFIFRPAGPAPEFMLRCNNPGWRTGMFQLCRLMATYPPDPSIMILAEIYGGRPVQELAPDLPAIVARLREMAFCLDVTEAPPADPEDALEALLSS
jgi:hypothetical protein